MPLWLQQIKTRNKLTIIVSKYIILNNNNTLKNHSNKNFNLEENIILQVRTKKEL